MSFAQCTACLRKHKRPVNSRCEYLKADVQRCAELGLSSSECINYLPELMEEDIDPSDKMAGKVDNGTAIAEGVGPHLRRQSEHLDSELIQQLVTESIQSRKLLESSQKQVERMMAQLLDLKLNTVSPGGSLPVSVTTVSQASPTATTCTYTLAQVSPTTMITSSVTSPWPYSSWSLPPPGVNIRPGLAPSPMFRGQFPSSSLANPINQVPGTAAPLQGPTFPVLPPGSSSTRVLHYKGQRQQHQCSKDLLMLHSRVRQELPWVVRLQQEQYSRVHLP